MLLTLATLAATTFVAASAGAQDTTVSRGEVAKAPTFNSLVAAINATPATVEALKARTMINETEIKLVNAKPLIEGQDESALKAALEQHAAAIEQLRTSLGAQAAITAALEKADPKVTIADVIAVEIHADGTLDLYFKAKES
jgi:hypothetical protein